MTEEEKIALAKQVILERVKNPPAGRVTRYNTVIVDDCPPILIKRSNKQIAPNGEANRLLRKAMDEMVRDGELDASQHPQHDWKLLKR